MLPPASMARPLIAALSCARLAGPRSPLNPTRPVPARVVMNPSGVTFRTLALPPSAIYRFPVRSKPIAPGQRRLADAAHPPSMFGADPAKVLTVYAGRVVWAKVGVVWVIVIVVHST